MGFWGWFGVFAGIAVLGLVVLGVLGLGLWRRGKVLAAELARLSRVADGLGTALDARERQS